MLKYMSLYYNLHDSSIIKFDFSEYQFANLILSQQ